MAKAGFESALLRAATGFAFDVISVVDASGRIVYNSESTVQVFGRPADHNIGQPALDLVHPEDKVALAEAMAQALAGNATPPVEYRTLGANGTWQVVESKAIDMVGDDSVAGIVVITRDVTEQRRNEALRTASTDILNSIALGERLNRSLGGLVQAACRRFGATGGAVLVRDTPDQDVRVLESRGVPDNWEETLSEALADGYGAPGWENPYPAATAQLSGDSAWSAYAGPARAAGFESCWSAPMIESTTGSHAGVLELYFAETRPADRADLSDLEELARLAGLAIERDGANRRLAYSSLYDRLTNLPNRDLFLDRLNEALTRTSKSSTALAVLSVDIDSMKDHNDRLGAGQGDVLLARVAECLEEVTNGCAAAARMGGDEFAILYEGIAGADEAVALAERVLDGVALLGPELASAEAVTVSIGVTISDPEGGRESPESIVRQAEVALVLAKRGGGARWRLFDRAMHGGVMDHSQFEAELRDAIRNDQLDLHYQPEFDLENGRLLGVEALVRWDHPVRGPVPAMDIIELAERSDLILDLGSWVLDRACEQASAWEPNVEQDRFKIWINLSQRQLTEQGMVQQIVKNLQRNGLRATSIGVEITETVLVADPVAAGKTITALRDLGVEVALDDFGTGYSSLSFLRRFPVDVVKIDGSFVAGLGQNQQDAAIVYSVVSMGHSLGLAVVAEGVETETQRSELDMLGCDRVQGWLYAPAMPADEMDAWMNRYEKARVDNTRPRPGRSYSALRPSAVQAGAPRRWPWADSTAPGLGPGSLMHLTAWLLGLCGALTMVTPLLPLGPQRVAGVETVGAIAIAIAFLLRYLPWRQWPRAAALALVPVAFTLIGFHNYFAGGGAYGYSAFFLLLYAWMGLTLPRLTSVATLPLLGAAFLAPLQLTAHPATAPWSLVYVATTCVLLGETVAWSFAHLRSTHFALSHDREWSQSLLRYSNDLISALDEEGRVVFASFACERLIGQRPSDLVGTRLFDVIHPDDRETATNAMDYVRERQGQPLAFDVRLRHRDRSWRWCALTAQNLLARPGVGAILINASDITERKRTGDLLAFHANHDPLTDLLNRASFNQHLTRALGATRRHHRSVSVLFIDLDGFKTVNDKFGHNIGDQLLKEVAHRLSGCLREEDCLARQGGDEFTAVLEETIEHPGALEVSRRIMAALAPPIDLGTTTVAITASIGVAQSSIGTDLSADRLTQLADIAMYRAKQLGKDQVYVLSPEDLPVMPV
ncbi:MAG: diguanylate cyclase domain-containing protein [Acidimicrobiales bacterium]